MAKLSYNDFRKLHKGIPTGQVSELWKKYKVGEYVPDADNDGVHDGDELVETSTEVSTEEETQESYEPEAPKHKPAEPLTKKRI